MFAILLKIAFAIECHLFEEVFGIESQEEKMDKKRK